ncbi:MAG: HipA domain-containing protein [Myxococcales bacterium]|nr:HipA domain-containing protein [Myxococcales bacterium]
MSGREAIVRLGELRVGRLVEGGDARIEFRIDPDYLGMARRPVLGQWFEDRRRATQSGERPGDLPPFFANLIPEGDLKLTLMERLNVAYDDDFGLLCAVGGDLPGAIVVEREVGSAPPRLAPAPPPPDSGGLRFSLAGVQLKFSMVRGADRFYMPGHDQRGGWIAKISYDKYPDLAANEWTTMEWARRAGFDVPATELRPLVELVDLPYQGGPDARAFLIERYDRSPDRRIHQEDFQQIVGRRPVTKYDDMTYDKLTLLATNIAGDGTYREVVRRLAFMVASGNDDAHMKNWSVVYPNGIDAVLSPFYDQVFTAQWPEFARAMALKVDGTKEFAEIDLRHFRVMAGRVQADEAETEAIVAATIATVADAWREVRDHPNVTESYRAALRRHWQRVPLLRPHALVI